MTRDENIRRCLLWASGRTEKQELAELIDAPRTRLSTFLSGKGDLTEEQFCNAEVWLKDNAYWIDESAGSSNSVSQLLASDMEAVAAILKSGKYPKQEKARKLDAWIRLTHDGLPNLLDAILGE